MDPDDVNLGMVFYDHRPYRPSRKCVTPRHLLVTAIEIDSEGKRWAICRTVSSGQTNTKMLCSSLVRFGLVSGVPGRILTLKEVRDMLKASVPASATLNRRGRR